MQGICSRCGEDENGLDEFNICETCRYDENLETGDFVRFYGDCGEWVEVVNDDQQGVVGYCGKCKHSHEFMNKEENA